MKTTGGPATSAAGAGTSGAFRRFALIVPAGWFCVPLPDDDERRRSVDALVETCFRGVDDQPLLRRQTRQTVVELSDRAVRAGGVQLYLALNTVAGLPLAASLLVSASAPASPGLPAPDTLTADLLLNALRRPGTDLTVVDLPAGRAVRRRALRRARPTDVLGPGSRAEQSPTLGTTMLDYAVPVPGSTRVLFLSFSSPLEVLADALVELFDAIAGTLRWKE